MRFTSIFAAIALCTLAAPSSFAHEYNVGAIHIGHPWSRVVPQGSNVASGYLVIENKGTTADRLIGGSTEIAGRFEIHQMTMNNGIMKMRELERASRSRRARASSLRPAVTI